MFAGRLVGSVGLSSGALKTGVRGAMSATDSSVLHHSFCEATVSGHMDCLHSTESSATYLRKPRLITTIEDGVVSQYTC